MNLRPYQQLAKEAVQREWAKGIKKTLVVQATGTGKTILFSKIAEDCVRNGERVLILAHRGELLNQAADKLSKSTGLGCAVEKAEETCLNSWFRIVVGSVQTLMNEKRLKQFPSNYFDTIIVDECHHILSASYMRVMDYFKEAKALGVTATADRSDMKNLGQYFETLAYEYTLPKAIKEGYLCKIKAQTIPLKLDLTGVGSQAGDYKTADLGSALDPYLHQIAEEMAKYCMDRKTVVFLPLIATSQKFRDILESKGFSAAEVNGTSEDRAQILKDFDTGKYNVLCNSMLLCLDTQTEILTDKGFVKCDEMTMQHKVANWNMDGTVYFEEPKEIVKRPLGIDEHMTSIESRTIDIRVTNTHRMVVSCGEGGKQWKKISAQELRNGHKLPAFGVAEPFDIQVEQPEWPEIKKTDIIKTAHYLRKTGQCDSTESSYEEANRRKEKHRKLQYTQPQDLSLDDCRFIGFWIADGTRSNLQSGGMEYQLCQSPHYPIIVKWIDDLVERLGFDCIRREKAKEPEAVLWSLPRGTGSGSQEKYGLFRIEPYLEKNGTELFWGLNEKQFDALVEGYWYGDGWHDQAESGMPDSIMMNDTKYDWINLLCSIGSVRGWRCNMMPRPSKNPKHNDQWGLRMIKGKHLNISCKTPISQESYSHEDVWCVRTSSKNIITRRHGHVTIMGNTEGWDCPSVDCIVVLRPTKMRSLYVQMVGRGTRLFPGKEYLLLLDFLWHTERLELCHPAHLICESAEVAQIMTDNIEEAGCPLDIQEAEVKATEDAVAAREEALAKLLNEMKRRKGKLVDPLQFEMSIQAEDLAGYVPAFGWEMGPPSDKQVQTLEKLGIFPDQIESAGKAGKILDRLDKRRQEGLTTPKQIRFLEGRGFQHVGTWQFQEAKNLIDRVAGNGWRVPHDINPSDYKGAIVKPDSSIGGVWL
jgi:superfamily II DNA or RNA helicase